MSVVKCDFRVNGHSYKALRLISPPALEVCFAQLVDLQLAVSARLWCSWPAIHTLGSLISPAQLFNGEWRLHEASKRAGLEEGKGEPGGQGGALGLGRSLSKFRGVVRLGISGMPRGEGVAGSWALVQ